MCRLRNIAMGVWQTDGQTDDGQSDPYVSLCFAGNYASQATQKLKESDDTLTWSVVHENKKSYAKFKLNMSKHVGEKCGKRVDRDPDGQTETGLRVGRTNKHHHTIIRPVWRRAYKNSVLPLFISSTLTCICGCKIHQHNCYILIHSDIFKTVS